jgi:methylthioribose-1-phosphate isomerase
MARGEVDVVIVGADRVAANGDTANKVGTYTLAVLASRHVIPFYVAAPVSSIDLGTATGAEILIEERSGEEVLQFRGTRIAPPNTDVRNPAFDVTPAELISGIVTEEGVVRRPFETSLAEAVAARQHRRGSSPGFAEVTGEVIASRGAVD